MARATVRSEKDSIYPERAVCYLPVTVFVVVRTIRQCARRGSRSVEIRLRRAAYGRGVSWRLRWNRVAMVLAWQPSFAAQSLL